MFYAFNCRGLKKLIKLVIKICVLMFVIYATICIAFPVKYIETIEKYADKYNLDTALVCAVINVESNFAEDARSSKGASGLMQIMKRTADWGSEVIGLEDYSYDRIFEPEINIEIGCWYLNRLMAQYDGNMTLVIAAYNAGSGNVSNWLYDDKYSQDGKTLYKIPYAETEKYLKRITFNRYVYDKLLKVKIYEK